jgi:hypothetical protein
VIVEPPGHGLATFRLGICIQDQGGKTVFGEFLFQGSGRSYLVPPDDRQVKSTA